jgi:DNA-binding MarR family transcriptional regulator
MPLGPALRRAWVGYQQRLDLAMADAGFADRGFPDGRVLRICARASETTISDIARELHISRQGAAKVVHKLREHHYLTVEPSPSSGREKLVRLTRRSHEYLAAHRDAARRIERDLRRRVGRDAFDALTALLDALEPREPTTLRDYIRSASSINGVNPIDGL